MIAEAVICLALNVYFEARSDPVEGRLAVALATVNRVKEARTTVCYEVFRPKQFSWTLAAANWRAIPSGPAWEDAKVIAGIVLDDRMVDFTMGADHYHAIASRPRWDWRKLKRIGVFGGHVFYRRIG